MDKKTNVVFLGQFYELPTNADMTLWQLANPTTPHTVAILKVTNKIDSIPPTEVSKFYKIDLYSNGDIVKYKIVDELPPLNIKQNIIPIKKFTNWNNGKYYLNNKHINDGVNAYTLQSKPKVITNINIKLTPQQQQQLDELQNKIDELQNKIDELKKQKTTILQDFKKTQVDCKKQALKQLQALSQDELNALLATIGGNNE